MEPYEEPLILALDTTSKYCSISISRNGDILIEYNFVPKGELSANLIPALEFLLKSVELELGDINLFGIAIGPGLFTGIRVGLATLKGLLFNENKPVVPVVTLEAMAYKYHNYSGKIISLIDARREEVYLGGYGFSGDSFESFIQPQLIHFSEIKNYVGTSQSYCFVGSGAILYKTFLKEHFGNVKILQRSNFLASEVCKLALIRFRNGLFVSDLQELNPLYVRKPDAETNFQEKK